MALEPVIFWEVQNCEQLFVRDDTVYGTGIPDPARGDARVNFTVTYKPVAGDSVYTLVYDSDTVSSVVVPLAGDGHYRITMRIRPNEDWAGADFDYSEEVNLFITCALRQCYIANVTEFFRNRCKCSTPSAEKLIRDIRLGFAAIDIKVGEQADYTGAQCILEELLARCVNTADCGCH